MTFSYIYHDTSSHISSKVANKQTYITKATTWHVEIKQSSYHIQGQPRLHIQCIPYPSYPQPNACSYECMTYLTPTQHLCINVWTYECVFMAKKSKHKKGTLI